MKSLITSILLFICLNISAQTFTYIPWTMQGQQCYGCASFYWKVDKSNYNNEYYFYISSTSFWSNGNRANTKLEELNIYVDNQWVYNVPWIVFNEIPFMICIITTPNNNPYISFTYKKIEKN